MDREIIDKRCESCGAYCIYRDRSDVGPCGGEMFVADIDYGGDIGYEWTHYCENHQELFYKEY